MRSLLFLFGYEQLGTDASHAADLLNLCMEKNIPYTGFSGENSGEIVFFCLLSTARRLKKLAQERNIPVKVLRSGGIPPWIWQRKQRAGLILGCICAIALFVASGKFVWDVRITGNEEMSVSEIKAVLSEGGLYVGSYKPSLDTDVLENRVLLSSDRLSWISVRINGTVAEVQVIERISAPKQEEKKPANLIATCDGQIETVELLRGDCVVKTGQAVKKGDLLVSGVYDSQTVGCRFTRAAGRVLARTEHTYRIEIPFTYTEKSYVRAEKQEICLNFFQKSLKIFKSTGNGEGECDIIEIEKSFTGLGSHTLPVSVTLYERRYYEEVTCIRSEQEALDEAYAQLSRELGAFSEGTQLLKKQITTTLTDDALILECTVLCIENIAEQAEFEVTELS